MAEFTRLYIFAHSSLILKINGLEDKKITKVARENLRARVYSMIFINSHAKSSNIKKEMRQYQVWK